MHRRRALALGLAAAVAAPFGPAFAKAKLTTAVNDLLAKYTIPGASLAVFEKGQPVFSEAYGVRVAGGAPMDTTMRFQAASLSKTVNALCVLALVSEGLIDLDAPVNYHLKGWQLSGPSADKVTPAHLLSHTGATTIHGFDGYPQGTTLPTLVNILNGAAPANSGRVANLGEPGKKYAYSGGGIMVLQKLVEDVTDSPYRAAVQSRVLNPLAMTSSTFAILPPGDTLAAAHNGSGGVIPGEHHDYPESAPAGLWTTPHDLALAVAAIVDSVASDGFLPKKLAQRMVKPGLGGAGLGTFASHGVISHSGSNLGFRTLYVANVKRRQGYVLMINSENGDKLLDKIDALVVADRGW